MVEFALIIPILLLLVMGAFDIGRLMYIKLSLNSIAREGAYHVSYYPADVTACTGSGVNTTCQPDAETRLAMQTEANNLGVQVNFNNAQVIGTRAQATPVEVRISQQVNLWIFQFLTGPVNITSSVRMMVQ